MDLDDNQLEKLMQAELNMREAIEDLENQVKDIKVKRAQIQNALNEGQSIADVVAVLRVGEWWHVVVVVRTR